MKKSAACFLVIFAILLSTTAALAGSISGTVTGPDGETPLAGIEVSLFVWNGENGWDWISGEYTDDIGQYEISDLEAGTYRIGFRDDSGNYLAEVYDNAPDLDMGADVAVAAEGVTVGINASLAAAAKISGTVTGPDGTTALEDIQVVAYSWNSEGWWDWVDSANTDAAGEYEIGGLAAGIYRVQFSSSGYYQGQAYNGAADLDAGQNIAVPASTIVGNINASLTAVGKISGTVTGLDGVTPLEGINVIAFSGNDEVGWDWTANYDYTDTDGSYEISGLVSGTYRVLFLDWDSVYMPETYNDVVGTNPNNGTDVNVVAGETTMGIDAALSEGATITGKVTGPDGTSPLEWVYVGFFYRNDEGGWDQVGFASTDADGLYAIGSLVPGTYRVQFVGSGYFMGQVYSGAANLYAGQDIVIVGEETVANINASLALGGAISGTVTGTDGITGLQSVQVEIYSWNGAEWTWSSSDDTDENGYYEIGSLVAGTYRVVFSYWNGGYLSETYDDVPGTEPANGTDVVVVAGETTGGIDAELERYASLSGVIESTVGRLPLSGVYVRLLGTANGENLRTQTTADGSYSFPSVHPGEYVVRAEPVRGSAHLGQWYEGILYVPGQDEIPAEAQRIVLANEEARTGIDFALDPAGRLAGTLTGEGMPIAAGRLRAENGTYGQAYWAWSDDAGSFEFVDLLPGTYTLKAEAAAYRDEWWSEAVHESEAVPFDVASGDDLVRDFDLASGQSPARVEVTSDPSGAAIFVNFQATTSTTPAVIDVGELGVALPGGFVPAPHVFAVRKNGHPRAAPQSFTAIEAETVEVHFDLTAEDAGTLAIQTDPAGAAVYVDYAGSGEGTTPVEVANLAPGSHVILLKADGYLQAKPVVAWVENGSNTAVSVPLAPIYSADRIQAEIQSAPTGAVIYVDYLPTPEVTDAVVDWMDPASHAGSGWHSASHAVMLRKQWHVPAAAYYVPDQVNVGQTHRVELIEDLAAALDEDDDGMPDQLEAPYQDLEGWGSQGPNDDYDGDGVSNLGEMIAGTRADDPDSVLEISATDAAVSGASITLTFHSVPGNRYFIRGASALAGEPEWINLGGVVLASETETTLTVPLPEGMDIRFVQLVVWAP